MLSSAIAAPCKVKYKGWYVDKDAKPKWAKDASEKLLVITNCVKGTLIQDINRPDWFWVLDKDGHGGAVWKVFKALENNQKFVIVGSADKDGTLMTKKHESTEGKIFNCK